jgi:hypothetical protein
VSAASFDAKGNATIIPTEDLLGAVDWANLPAGTYFLPGGQTAESWQLRLERPGLEFGVLFLLPPGTELSDYSVWNICGSAPPAMG